MAAAQSAIVSPCGMLSGVLSVPGDKSISHRVAILSSLSRGTSSIRNFLHSEDCISTMRAMEALGARVYRTANDDVRIEGACGKLMQPADDLDVGNSGTTIRLLSGVAAAQPMTVVLTGDQSLCSRPMKRIKDPLEQMGASVELTGEKGTAPIRITGGRLHAVDYVLPVASAQVKSCVLFAAMYAEGMTTIIEPAPTRDHTERLLRGMGIDIGVEKHIVQVQGFGPAGPPLKARHWYVPGDFSSAAFLILAAASKPGSDITMEGVGLNPRRTAFLDVLRRMGADISAERTSEASEPEPYGRIHVRGASLKGANVGGDEIPNLIDELPLVAAAGALANGRTVIRDAAELRVKESDRIAAMAANLASLGVEVEEMDDGMVVHGPADLAIPPSGVRSYGDHRIAMAMAVLGLFAPSDLCINNVSCVDTSYPGFWKDLRRLGADVDL